MTLTVREIDEIIRKMNAEEILKRDQGAKYIHCVYLQGFINGIDREKNKLRCSAFGESDWVRIMLDFRKQSKLVCDRFNAWLISKKSEPLKLE